MRERKTEMSNIPSRDLAPWFQLVEMRECDKSSAPIGRLHFSECNRIKLDAPFDISLGTMNGALLDHLKGCINDSEKSSRSTVPSSVNPLSLSPSLSLSLPLCLCLCLTVEARRDRNRIWHTKAGPCAISRGRSQIIDEISNSKFKSSILRASSAHPPQGRGISTDDERWNVEEIRRHRIPCPHLLLTLLLLLLLLLLSLQRIPI